MKSTERVLIYSCLLALAGMNLASFLGAGDRTAVAGPAPGWADLGPAEALRLTRADGADLVMRNAEGRLSWGKADTDRAYSAGVVHIGEIMRQLMESDVLVEERDALNTDLREQEEAIFAQRQALEAQYADLKPDDPAVEDARREFNELRTMYEQFRASASAQVAELAARQIEQGYRELVTAVNVVADRTGVDVVERFIPTDDPFEATNPDQALAAIRLRNLLRYPDGVDLTTDILEELSLDVE